MRLRHVPAAATWLLKLFCSGSEDESLIGDLVEQYQQGRGRFWYWRQVSAIVFLRLHRRVRGLLVSSKSISTKNVLALIFLIAAFTAVLLTDIWMLFLVAILGGVITGGLIFWINSGRIGPTKSELIHADGSDEVKYHPGISIHHIPVEGGSGLLFVLGTIFIFGTGVAAVRELLVLTVPLGIITLGILVYWHKHHPLEIQGLDLQERKQHH